MPGPELVGRLDRMGLAREARALGLPPELAERVAEMVVECELPADRRAEVFRELVAHFEDGLAAGRTPAELLAAFGDGKRAAAMVRREKRVVTPPAMGGTGPGDGPLRRLARDARYAFRRLAARPAFTLIAVVSLAIGIGANSAMFTLVNEVLFRRPPLDRPEELTEVYVSQEEFPFNVFSYPDLQDFIRGTADVFEGVAGSKLAFASRETGDGAERVIGELVTGNFFELLGIRPALGRTIGPADASAPGAGAVLLLGDGYWRRSFGADPGVVGRTVRLSGAPYTVIGVLRSDYPGTVRGVRTDFYAPITRLGAFEPSQADPLTNRSMHSIFTKARLRPGVGIEQARVAAARVTADQRERFPGEWHRTDAITLIPSREVILFPPIDRLLAPVAWLVMVVVGLVLVVACANLAGFLLARAVDRRKEIAVRLSLGATRSSLIAQLLTETVLLSLAGGALGVVIGRLGLGAALAADLPLPVPIALALPLDLRVLGFSILVSIGAGVLFGLAPALQSTRLDLASVIRVESTIGGRGRGVLRGVLVAGQVAMAVVLLVGAGLFVRSLDAVRSVDPGFGARPTGVLQIGLPGNRGSDGTLRGIETIERRIARIPGVESVGATSNLHLSTHSIDVVEIKIDGIEPPPGRETHTVDRAAIDTGFVTALGLRLVRGRTFTADDRAGSRTVAIVNQAFADEFFPGREPVGREIRRADGTAIEVVGLVATAKIRTIAEDPRPFVYFPLAQAPTESVWLVARTAGDAGALVGAMMRAVREVDPDVFVTAQKTLASMIQVQTLPIGLGAALIGGAASLALVLACIGLYGTVSYSVSQRTREMGIRLSLGADRSAVVRLLMAGGLRLVVAGAAVGIVLALALAGLLQRFLFGVPAFDPATFALVPLALVLVAAVAAYVPARRAGRVDPTVALRSE
jgi:predicted permease